MTDELSSSSSSSPPPDSHINHAASIEYWSSITPDVNGMLGGFPQISQIDLRGSASFLAKVRRVLVSSPNTSSSSSVSGLLKRGADCGAGIGRVTNGFLSKVCEVVDVVEPVEGFAEKIRDSELKRSGKVDEVYVTGIESWEPSNNSSEGNTEQKKYDLIWNQWCVGHLTDRQLVEYLRRCKAFLAPSGFVVVKENVSTDPDGRDMYDDVDSSVTRTDAKFRAIFKEAGYGLIKSEEQLGFPKSLGLFPVRFYALRPALVEMSDDASNLSS